MRITKYKYKPYCFLWVVLIITFCTACSTAINKVDDSSVKTINNNHNPHNFISNLTHNDKEHLISTSYLAINDAVYGQNKEIFSNDFNALNNKVFVTLRLKGKKISQSAEIRSDNLEKSVYLAAVNACKVVQKHVLIKNTGINIEITILGKEKKDNDLFDFEPGLHSIKIKDRFNGSILLNKNLIEDNYGQKKLIIPMLCHAIGRSDFCNNESDNTPEFYIYESLNFGNTHLTGKEVITFYRGNNFNSKMSTIDERDKALQLTEKWLFNNVRKNDYLSYEYYPSVKEYSKDNNAVRQLFASRCLAEIAQRDETVKVAHKKNLDYIFKNWYCERGNNEAYVCFSGTSELGANAGLIRILVYSPYFEEYRTQAEKVADAVLSVQKEDGSLTAFLVEPQYSYDEDRFMAYYSGETIIALTELYHKTGKQKYLDAAIKAQNYYLIKYVDNMDINYHSAYVPWHSQSLFKLYQIIKDDRYLTAIFKMTDRLIESQNIDGKPFADYKGRFKKYFLSSTHSSADGVFTEGLCYAYEAAKISGDMNRQKEYGKRVLLGLENIMRLQFSGANMYYIENENIDKVEGGIRTNITDNRIRIDNVQHAFDAFSAAKLFLTDNEGYY